MVDKPEARFDLGNVVATPGALRALEESAQLPHEFLLRHLQGDWGEVDKEDWAANDWSVDNEARIISAYTTNLGVKIWVISEQDRSVTTILIPSEY